jgi:uncharacterized membrane protein
MNPKIKKFVPPFAVAFIVYVFLDYLWVTCLSGDFYFRTMRPVANTNIVGEAGLVIHWAAAVVYGLLALGVTYLVKPQKVSLKESAVSGLLYGLVVFGVYDFTNHATLVNWALGLVAPDVIWGAITSASASMAVHYFCKD